MDLSKSKKHSVCQIKKTVFLKKYQRRQINERNQVDLTRHVNDVFQNIGKAKTDY